MLPSSRLRWVACVLILLAQASFGTDWRQPEAQLAEKIAALTGPGVVALEISNRCSLASAEVDEIRRGLISALGGSGIRVWQPDQAAATIKVTLSENLQSFVWTAEISQGSGEPGIAMVSMPRPDSSFAAQSASPVVLSATRMMSSAAPILDFVVLEGSPRRALALGGEAVTIFEFRDGKWKEGQALPIAHANVFPRDLRGRIVLRRDHLFDAYLPGVVCRSTNAAPLSMSCAKSDDPWPLQTEDAGVSGFFAPARNFFTGALVPGIGKQKSAPAFYSAAAIAKDKYVLWVFAGVNGQLQMLDGINQQSVPRVRWGSDIAGVHATCRAGWQVIATTADDNGSDALQAFEFPDRDPVPVSQKINLNGAVTALWAQSSENVNAVYRSAETGDYEAVQLTLACSQ
jgi:hypothetical protein